MKVCFIPHSSPEFLGGVSMFHNNLINYAKSKKMELEITWIYVGKENREYFKDSVKYIEIKGIKAGFLGPNLEKLTFVKILKNNDFDILCTSAGIWADFYKKPKKQKLIHIFHGNVYYFNKNRLREFGLLKKILFSPVLLLSYLEERISKKADEIICVSEKVKKQVENTYGKQKNIKVIRTGVDIKNFKKRNKNNCRKKLGLEKDKIYGLYVGGGGYWTKGLDRAVKISEKIYKKNKDFRLLIIGPDYEKVKHLIKKDFVEFLRDIPRREMPFYYNSVDVFFCMSRYEGGAPTLVVSEAIASGCFLVCSKDSQQEILENEKNSLIIEEFGKKDAEKILETLKDKKKKERMIKNSLDTIKELSLEKWGKRVWEALLYPNEHKI